METKLTSVTVSDLSNSGKLNFSRGRYNILDCGVRTGKTYWAVHNLIQYTRDQQNRRILFLTDTTFLKNDIINKYPELCCDADEMWIRSPDSWTVEDNNKIGIMCYQGLGMKVLKEDTAFLDTIDVICWDECDSIFDFAATAFQRARKYDYARAASTNNEILALIQEHSSRKEYMPLILLGYWEKIIYEGRILCIGLSASPDRAKEYYSSLTNASNKGKLETSFRAASDIYFKNVIDHIHELKPLPGVAYWCYSPSITHNKSIVRAGLEMGFNAIEIHSEQNVDWPLDDEQKRVINWIRAYHRPPPEYDFIVITKAFERGFSIEDERFKHLIVDSYYQSDRIQAARQTFPYQRHVKTLITEVPKEFKDRWLTVQECRELAEYLEVPEINLIGGTSNNSTRNMSWNKLQTVLPMVGYTIEKARKRINNSPNALNCYKITGEWKEAEIVGDNNFFTLVAAKSNQELVKLED